MTTPKLFIRQGIALEHVGKLARRFSDADHIECGAVAMTPYTSLVYGRDAGTCWSVFEGMDFEQVPVAVGGFTKADRSIWAYFGDLSPELSKEFMRESAKWIRDMTKLAGPGYPLHNCVWEGNTLAIAWLKATHCFNWLDKPLRSGPNLFLQFEAKPWEEMPVHV